MNIFAIPLTERLAKHTAGVTFARQLSERREARRRPASAAVSTKTTTAARAGAAMMADRVPTRQVRQSPRLAELPRGEWGDDGDDAAHYQHQPPGVRRVMCNLAAYLVYLPLVPGAIRGLPGS